MIHHACGARCFEDHNAVEPNIFLRPCPCCAGAVDWDGDNSILCEKCGLRMPSGADDRSTAKAWNMRAEDARPRHSYREAWTGW